MREPSEAMLSWVRSELGSDTRIVDVRGLGDDGSPWLLSTSSGGTTLEVVLKPNDPDDPDGLRIQVAALRFAREHELPAPELIAEDLDGSAGSGPLMLTGRVVGSSSIPTEPSTARLEALGEVTAILNRIPLTPRPDLPLRTRPIPFSDFSAERRQTQVTTPLLAEADAYLDSREPMDGPTVFVHGDLWQGQILWEGDVCAGIVDWDCAGAGHYGVDLSAVRLDAALAFGPEHASVVQAAWERRSGFAAENVAHWDVVAAANMPTDMALFAGTMQGQGRPDLDADTINERRDAFLRAALDAVR